MILPPSPVTLLTPLLSLGLFPGLARVQTTACGAKIHATLSILIKQF